MVRLTIPRPSSDFVVDFFLSSHLGDALCSTPLVRLLTIERKLRVSVVKHRSTLSVFANNPYVCGFTTRRGPRLYDLMEGDGHMIQRLQRGLGLSVNAVPRPEVYLSAEERAWAEAERAKWPSDRPVCILSTRVVTNARYYLNVDWGAVAAVRQEGATIVQPVISGPSIFREQVGLLRRPEEWTTETAVPGAIVYRDLPLRRYMALFSVADCFCGGLAGGAHLAAAFSVPALIVIWRELQANVHFPSTGARLATTNWPYPYHHYIAAEDLAVGNVNRTILANAWQTLLAAPINLAAREAQK